MELPSSSSGYAIISQHWLLTRLSLILSASQASAVACGPFDALYLTLQALRALKKMEIKRDFFDFFPPLIQSYLCDLVPNIVFGFLIILRRGVAEATQIRLIMTLIMALSQPICTFGL